MIIFAQSHVIVTQRRHIQYTIYVVKTVNPFSSLWPLTANIKNSAENIYYVKFITDIFRQQASNYR